MKTELAMLVSMINKGGPSSPSQLAQAVVITKQLVAYMEDLENKVANSGTLSGEEVEELKATIAQLETANSELKKERTTLKSKVTRLEKKMESDE